MALTIKLLENGNENTSRRFLAGSELTVEGTVYGKLLPSIFQFVRIDITKNGEVIFFQEDRSGLLGGYSFKYVLPQTSASMTIKIQTSFPLGGVESKEVPIAVGTATLGELPPVEKEESFFTNLDTVLKILPLVIVALIIFYIINQTRR